MISILSLIFPIITSLSISFFDLHIVYIVWHGAGGPRQWVGSIWKCKTLFCYEKSTNQPLERVSSNGITDSCCFLFLVKERIHTYTHYTLLQILVFLRCVVLINKYIQFFSSKYINNSNMAMSRVDKWYRFSTGRDQFLPLDCKGLQYIIIKFRHHILLSFIYFLFFGNFLCYPTKFFARLTNYKNIFVSYLGSRSNPKISY
jgi:hypothetical protein